MNLNKVDTAIILAAGKNTRFDKGMPKSLHHIGGMTLLERHIRELHKVRIHNIAVVTGYRGNMIAEYIDQLNRSLVEPVQVIHNPDFELANAHSIYVTRDWILSKQTELFLCTMADHVFASTFYEHLVREIHHLNQIPDRFRPDPCILNLAVDKPGHHNSYVDLQDVTRVIVEAYGKHDLCIQGAGKLIDEYNYFDTGLFVFKMEVFDHLERIFKKNLNSITDLVNHLAGLKESRAIDLTGIYWNDIDTPEDFKIVQSQIDKFA